MAEALISFHGAVRCERAAAPLGLTLRGSAGAPGGGLSAVAFSACAPADLPDTLEDARVTPLGAGRYRITSAGREWVLAASAAHLTHDVAAEFYRVLPPRPVPLKKRLLWRAVLALAASRAGLVLLRALRR